MAAAEDALKAILKKATVSKTVYALVMPETRRAADAILGGNPSPERDGFHKMYNEAWTQKQDAAHKELFAKWKEWSGPVVKAGWSLFPFMYPTAGASEGLREAVSAYGNRARVEKFEPIIHVFAGEYEGYAAYAAAAGIPVIEHSRKNWQSSLSQIGPRDQFYLSQPSALDGNVWPEFDEFAQALYKAQPAAQLMLDLTYVGAVAREFTVKADHPNIPIVFFSLSKPMGVYYHRIGGCLSREEYPGLYGNMWFKNLLSLRLGVELMTRHGVHDLPRKYASIQAQAAAGAGKKLGLDLKPSDVFLLAAAKPGPVPSGLERYLTRGPVNEGLARVCLSPAMNQLISSSTPATPQPGRKFQP